MIHCTVFSLNFSLAVNSSKQRILQMKAALPLGSIQQHKSRKSQTLAAGRKSLELGHKPTKKSLSCSALKEASQHLNIVIRKSKYGKTKSIQSYFLFLRGSAWITICIFFETIYLILVILQEVAAVRSVASSSKFYQLLPDEENTDCNMNVTFYKLIHTLHTVLYIQ